MRVTNNMMTGTATAYLARQMEQILKTQQKIFTGKRINKPSDDYIGIGKVLDYRKTLSSIDQYSRNIMHGKTRLELIDTTLGGAGDLIVQAKNWASDMSTGSSDETTRNIAAQDLKNIYDQILQLANTEIGNSYIFSGHKTDTPPFSRDADGIEGTADDYVATYNGDQGDFRLIIGQNIDIKIKADGEEIFQTGIDVFDVLKDLIDGIENNDTTTISDQVGLLADAYDQINNIRAEEAAVYTRLEITENYWASFKPKVEDMLSYTEDADLTKAVIDLQVQETSYQVSLETAAMIIQPSLINFLR